MIKNSIDLAQILSAICLEPYTTTYYQMVENVYNCLKNENFLFIYVGPKRHGIALDFQTKLCNDHRTLKKGYHIVLCENSTQFEQQLHSGDVLLFLDNNEELLETAKKNSVFTLSLLESQFSTNINYVIPCGIANRASEIQHMILNGISEEILKFLP